MVPSRSSSVGRALAGEAAQAAQGDLDVARAEFDAVVEVAELALFPDLDRRAVAADSPPMRMPFGVVAAVPKGEVPPVPIHLLPPAWRSFCSARRFLNCLHQLVPAELFELGALGVGLRCFFTAMPQPVLGNRRPFRAAR
jgi:hypothetical protein